MRIVVLVSGRGSNFQAIVDNVAAKNLSVTCTQMITDNPNAYAIHRAHNAGIPVTVIDYHAFPSRKEYEVDLLLALDELQPDLIVLAGYMRIIGKEIVLAYKERIINIHPSLLPSFPGLHAQAQALAHGVKVAGCTVHFVDEEMDAGPIILQRCVRVCDDDTVEVLEERILAEEHIALSHAIQLFCDGKLKICDRRVFIL
ncbi:MAG: phosphoribosylglycinamide formyltransferase [Methanomicrobiales archaeon]|jgi:phosphoribosylglycinamide formyltransferase-1|nr:phosphoribosylglycinamide formyltransferase [Methanomicrobiales archaeon]